MKLIKFSVPNNFNLFQFGDDHEGTCLRHKEGWEQLVDMMNSPYGGLKADCNFGVDHGDIVEAIAVDDKRYDEDTTSLKVSKQEDQAVINREKIKDKLVCIMEGNHPRKLKNYREITKEVCKKLGVNFGTWSAKITYYSGNSFYFKQFATHGSRTISSTADDPLRAESNMRLILKRLLKNKFGDCLLMSMGHSHKLIVTPPINALYMADDGKEIKQHYTQRKLGRSEYIHPDHRWYINTGAFYKLYEDGKTSYAEIAGYDPIELGFCVVRYRDGDIEGIDKVTI